MEVPWNWKSAVSRGMRNHRSLRRILVKLHSSANSRNNFSLPPEAFFIDPPSAILPFFIRGNHFASTAQFRFFPRHGLSICSRFFAFRSTQVESLRLHFQGVVSQADFFRRGLPFFGFSNSVTRNALKLFFGGHENPSLRVLSILRRVKNMQVCCRKMSFQNRRF